MPTTPHPCPNCGTMLALPVPVPERVACPKCKTVLNLTGTTAFAPQRVRPGTFDGGEEASSRAPTRSTTTKGMGLGCWLGTVVGGVLLLGAIGGVGWLVLNELKDSPKDKDKDQAKTEKDKDKDQAKTEKDKDKNKESANAGPRLLLTEDFRSPLENGRPKGWIGDAFRVTKDPVTKDPCLENGSANDIQWVTLPTPNESRTLSGNFSIGVVYYLNYGRTLALRLDGTKSTAVLPVVIKDDGAVTVGTDLRNKPDDYKPHLPTRFVLTREGKKLSVTLNGDFVGNWKDEGTEYDKFQIGLPPGKTYGRVYKVTIDTLP